MYVAPNTDKWNVCMPVDCKQTSWLVSRPPGPYVLERHKLNPRLKHAKHIQSFIVTSTEATLALTAQWWHTGW